MVPRVESVGILAVLTLTNLSLALLTFTNLSLTLADVMPYMQVGGGYDSHWDRKQEGLE